MTIALGILASDGVLIAADTEETQGGNKLDQSKISASIHLSENSSRFALVTGSGDGMHLDAFAQAIDAGPLRDPRLATTPKLVFEQALEKFYDRKILSFNTREAEDRPDIWTVIGYAGEGRACLFETDKRVVVSRHSERFAAVGSGAGVARGILRRFLDYAPSITLSEAVLVASYAVLQAKETQSGVGKRTEIWALGSDGASSWIHREQQTDIDTAMLRYAERMEPLMFWSIAGRWGDDRALQALQNMRSSVAAALAKTPLRPATRGTPKSPKDQQSPRSTKRDPKRRPPSRE